MRVLEVHIREWRNLRDIHITLLDDPMLVCLVGENGTGKSSILELVADAFRSIGVDMILSAREAPRSITGAGMDADLIIDVSPWDVDVFQRGFRYDSLPSAPLTSAAKAWDCTLLVEYRGENPPRVTARNIEDPAVAAELGSRWRIGETRSPYREPISIHNRTCLLHGPDRFFVPSRLPPEDVVDRPPPFRERYWEDISRNWMRELVGPRRAERTAWEQQALERLRAGETVDGPPPPYPPEEVFAGFDTLLPHLGTPYAGENTNEVVFDGPTGRIDLSDLSSGEKDVLFTAVYVAKFADNSKVLLMDEPELHLHPDLVRRRLEHLRSFNDNSQTWIATHSYEAISVAGEQGIFVLSRSPKDGLIHGPTAWSQLGAATELATRMGYPSIPSALSYFVFIEGTKLEDQSRFRRIAGRSDVRFIAADNCQEVIKHTGHLINTARQAKPLGPWHVGGIVDRDFRSDQERFDEMNANPTIYVLECQVEENLFLHPDALSKLLDRADIDEMGETVVQSVADIVAGQWILGHLARSVGGDGARIKRGKWLHDQWQAIDLDRKRWSSRVLANQDDPTLSAALVNHLPLSLAAYAELRLKNEQLWLLCPGKAMLPHVAKRVGASSSDVLIQSVAKLWNESEMARPAVLVNLLTWIESIPAVT